MPTGIEMSDPHTSPPMQLAQNSSVGQPSNEREIGSDSAALIIVDHQRGVFEEWEQLRNHRIAADPGPLQTRVAMLVRAARERGLPVVWACLSRSERGLTDSISAHSTLATVIRRRPSFCVIGDDSAQLYDPNLLEPHDGLITRAGHSAFQWTPLDRVLSRLKVDTCVVAGGAATQ
ncbi:MAG: cysteine hydrolase family protein, partial [Phycisphaerales bacterium]